MNTNKNRVFAGLGCLAAVLAVKLALETPAEAQRSNMPPLNVEVTNDDSIPIPVTGEITLGGTSSITGTVDAQQSGTWNVEAQQSGSWTLGIDPSANAVQFAPQSSTVLLDTGLLIVNDGESLALAPLDLTGFSEVRLLAQAVNGEVDFNIESDLSTPLRLERYELGDEDFAEYRNSYFEVPGPGIQVTLTEVGGPGGANARLVIMAR